MPPEPSAGDGTVDGLRGRVHDLEGEVARLTLRVKDLQPPRWGRKAERGLGAPTAAAQATLALFEEALVAAPSADAPPTASAARRGRSRSTRGCRAR